MSSSSLVTPSTYSIRGTIASAGVTSSLERSTTPVTESTNKTTRRQRGFSDDQPVRGFHFPFRQSEPPSDIYNRKDASLRIDYSEYNVWTSGQGSDFCGTHHSFHIAEVQCILAIKGEHNE